MNTESIVTPDWVQFSLSPKALRWLHKLIHTPGFGVLVGDLEDAAEAVRMIDRLIAQLDEPPRRPSAAPPPRAEAPGRRPLDGSK